MISSGLVLIANETCTGEAFASCSYVKVLWEVTVFLLLVAGWVVGFRVTRRSGLGVLLPFGAVLLLFLMALAFLIHYWWRLLV